jgi:hypothetical protein
MPPQTQSSSGRAFRGAAAAWALAAALTALLAAPGCNILGAGFLLVHGPPKMPRAHTLEPRRPTAVFVDDPYNILPRAELRRLIGREVEQRLIAEKAIRGEMINSQHLMLLVRREEPGQQRSVSSIGREAGAEVVIWVRLDNFSLSQDGESFAPGSVVRVKVIDTVADERAWPEDPSGHRLQLTMPRRPADTPQTYSQRVAAERQLAQFTGKGVAELFYDEPRKSSARASR